MKDSQVVPRNGRRIARCSPLTFTSVLGTLLLGLLAVPSANASTGPAAQEPPHPARPAPSASSGATGAQKDTPPQAKHASSHGAPGAPPATPPGDASHTEPGLLDRSKSDADRGVRDDDDGLNDGASEFLKSQNFIIQQDQTVLGDRYFLGKSTQIAGVLNGDLHAFGESAKVTGSVTGDLNVLSKSLDVIGEVGDDTRALCQTLEVTGRIDGDLMVMAGQIDVLPGAFIGGRTLAFGQELTLSGHFARNVRAGGGEIVFGGQADGNVDVESDVLRFEPGAHIKGNLTYKARQELDALQGAAARKIVDGKVIYVPPQSGEKESSQGSHHWLWEIWTFISAFIVGCLLIAVGRGAIRPIIDALQSIQELLWSCGFGLIGHVCSPFAGIVLIVLCLTLPLGCLVLGAWVALFYVAKLAVAASLGDAVLRMLGWSRSHYLALLLGMIPIWVLFMVPILGPILQLIVVPMLGIGAILFGLRTYALGAPGPPASTSPGGTVSSM